MSTLSGATNIQSRGRWLAGLAGAMVAIGGTVAGGCANSPTLFTTPISTGSVNAPATAPVKGAKRVIAAKATQMYVWNAFLEKDCSPLAPTLAVTQSPGKGQVTFKPGETVTVQHSASGKCVGQRMAGTGIYYTPGKDQSGADRFSVTATTPSGQTMTRSFNVNVVQQ